MNIDDLINDLIKREGGFVDDVADSGGATNHGITLKQLDLWLGKQCSVNDIRNLDKNTAYQIYYSWYFIKPGFDALPACIQPVIFDAGVNQGQKTAIKFLQDVLVSHGFNVGKIDGVLGDNTIDKAKSYADSNYKQLVNSIVNRRIVAYNNTVHAHPEDSKFLDGWIARARLFSVN